MKIACVILHYNTINDTIKCVNSILNCKTQNDVNIVIVDNFSNNESGKTLADKYKGNIKIKVILNKSNLGFSSGNNVGFKYAKYDLKSDIIILFNNDTFIISNDFFEEIVNSYRKNYCAVIGPKIILKDGKYNPINLNDITVERVKKDIKYYKKILKLIKFNMYKPYFIAKRIKDKIIFTKKNKLNNSVDEEFHNIILHGCCLIFTPIYVKKFDGLDEKTFMYAEEELLLIKLKNNKMQNYYNPNLIIGHSEYSASNTIPNANYKRFSRMLEANVILLQELEKNE